MLYTPFPLGVGVRCSSPCFFLFFNTGPSNAILANVTHPSIRATAFAVNILIIHALGDAISPPVLGWVSDRFSMNAAFGLVGLMLYVWRRVLAGRVPATSGGTRNWPHRTAGVRARVPGRRADAADG